MPLPELILFAAWCAVASVAQSVSGFGFGVIMVAVLPLFTIGIQRVVVLVTLLVTVNIAIALWRLRGQLALRRVAWLVVGVPFGIPVGVYLLTSGPEWLLRALLGAVLVLAAAEPLVLQRLEPASEKRGWALVAGVMSGALGGALSTGGPPIVIYFHRLRWPKELTKASVMLTFAFTVALRLVAYGLKGLITRQSLVESAILCPVVVVASLVGERLFRALSQRGFRRAVAVMLAVCGVYELYQAVRLVGGA